MNIDFSSVRNYHEQVVFDLVSDIAAKYKALAGNPELLADVACVALSHLPPRYIRHIVDFSFFRSEAEREASDEAARAAVDEAFNYVQARQVMQARV